MNRRNFSSFKSFRSFDYGQNRSRTIAQVWSFSPHRSSLKTKVRLLHSGKIFTVYKLFLHHYLIWSLRQTLLYLFYKRRCCTTCPNSHSPERWGYNSDSRPPTPEPFLCTTWPPSNWSVSLPRSSQLLIHALRKNMLFWISVTVVRAWGCNRAGRARRD